MSLILNLTLIFATMAVGAMAGVFWIYANAIMPGLGTADDRTFVGSFQSIDRAIINPVFLTVFFSGLPLTAVALAMQIASGESGWPWTAAAGLLYLITIGITGSVHVPRNDRIKSAGHPDTQETAARVRAEFSEVSWTRWNRVRVLATTVAFACLCGALLRGGIG